MNADVRVVRLMRKIIRDQKDVQNMHIAEQSDYFATDYFDVMKVEKKELSSSFTSIMGIWPDEKMDVLDVAAQSYSLYCSEKMMELEKNREECGDPFLTEDKKFLSIIQIHITPEVMAHALVDRSVDEIMDIIYEDLHSAMIEFINVHKSDSLIFRIYKMLSAGDFAVVLRSSEAETSFRISSLLRRRIMEDNGGKRLVLYKTYTLLTFGNDVINQEIEEHENNSMLSQGKTMRSDRFVLRCCYSNLYWSDKEKVNGYLNNEDVLSEIQLYGLNGRYDFSVRITEKQFLELLHDIKVYKETGGQLTEDNIEKHVESDTSSHKEDGIVKYMRYLMKNRYLSYINERYLVAQNGDDEKQDVFEGNILSKTICTTSVKTREEFLDYRINEMYTLVDNKCQMVHLKIDQIKDYRKNMKHYMCLLDKLIKLCYGINGFSDTRIYAAVLLEQLDVIMESIEVYMEMYQHAEEKEGILNLLEEYIRGSVCALDGYAQYIRNNNLQSLQTPNYNIESNMSMEKLLIGYSEFLKVFTEFYQRKKIDLINKENQCEYLPIVVPVLSERDVSVETLFPKGVMDDWNKERGIRNRLNSNRYCMVISVPTLAELGNVRTMITSLFHEVAHQFRYESRKERNDALLKYVVHTIMRDVINELVQKLQNDTELRDWNVDFGRSLEMPFVESYLEMNYMNKEGQLQYSFQEAPLSNFQDCLKHDINEIFGEWGQKSDIRSVLRTFLKKTMYYYQPDKSQCSEAIELLDELFEKIEQDDDKIYEMIDNKVAKCAYVISWECACHCKNNDIGRIWGNKDFKEWILDEGECKFKEKWSEVFYEKGTDKISEVEEIWDNFFKFSCWIYESCGNDYKTKKFNNRKRVEFLERTYQKICENWNGEKMQKDLNSDSDSILSSMGRALGIDCKTKENYENFEERITAAVNQKFNDIMGMVEWRIGKYREEIADMFMCNAMELTPFGYMYMLAVSWPSNQELPYEYYNRSQNLLLFQWCLDDDNKLSYDKFRELCVQIIKMLEEAITRAAGRLVDMGEKLDLPRYMDDSVEWNTDDEEQVINLINKVEKLKCYCEYVGEQNFNWNNSIVKQECEILKFYGIMAHMMDQLIDRGMGQIDYLNDFKELRDDYIRGARQLKDLNYEMCTDDDPLVQQLGKFCKEISVLQNNPYLMMEDIQRNEDLNKHSIEFLLSMYYANKRRVAQQVGGE